MTHLVHAETPGVEGLERDRVPPCRQCAAATSSGSRSARSKNSCSSGTLNGRTDASGVSCRCRLRFKSVTTCENTVPNRRPQFSFQS